ncbi:helix-turn-helix domain-containing protein [Streptomyces abikoensis]|uniref:helix-turn-helix domain-containing protein n=1 Tax=Streptomyces abikoensis TaxID=97398 RepID=UPI0016759140|nr:helix-turn-helix transcriptional regulator [Streptomyces abikoensis]GGP46788.1 hypothetical protein GCM10010214_19930 [Streptomyces abikoensis]
MPHPLKLVRASLGDTQSSFARRIARRHQELGFGQMGDSRSKVAAWENSGTPPDRNTQRALADLLGVSWRDTEQLGWPHWLHLVIGDYALINQPWTLQGAIDALRSATWLADTRLFSEYPTVAGPTVHALVEQWQKAMTCQLSLSSPDGKPISPGVITWACGCLEEFASVFLEASPATIFPTASGFLHTLTRFLSDHAYDQEAGTELLLLASRNAGLCGAISLSLGEVARAERYFLMAARSATAAGVPLAAATYMGGVAYGHLIVGAPGDVLPLVNAIREMTQGSRPHHAMAAFLEARAHARLNDVGAAARALELADITPPFPAVEKSSRRHRLGSVNAWAAFSEGITWLHLGQSTKAMELFAPLVEEDALVGLFPIAAGDLCFVTDAQLAVGDIEAAVNLASRVLALYCYPPGAVVRRYKERFIAYRAVPIVRDFLLRLAEHPKL